MVAGWTEPRGTRTGFGALILAAHDPDGRLVYVGDVGTGFNGAELDRVLARLQPLASDRSARLIRPRRRRPRRTGCGPSWWRRCGIRR